ncbi:MAG: glycosyltransferase family 4 protein [Candidatus Brocadiae bacterium]|nr:glycosyltransferase family 4 protein [Candidatus Brocadiia bacterium]
MKIGINALSIEEGMTGIGNYTKDLVNALAEYGEQHSYCILSKKKIMNRRKENWEEWIIERMDRVWEELHIPYELSARGMDMYHTPLFACPIVDEIPCLITIHDVIPEKKPELCGKVFLDFYHARIEASLRAAVKVITVSEFSKKEIMETLGVASEKIEVIYQGIGEEFCIERAEHDEEIKRRLKLPDKYILYVGMVEERKNIKKLIEAFGKIEKELSGISLVIAGRKDDSLYTLQEEIEKAKLQGKVVETGYVREEDLPGLYRGAEIFAFPSLYEGFGRPILEAMASGVPVVTSNTTSLAEIAEDAAILVNPMQTESIAEGLLLAYKDKEERKKLREKGIKRAKEFTKKKFGESLMKFYGKMEESIVR